MKKKILFAILVLLAMPLSLRAQFRFGYVSYAEVCQQMHQYEEVKQHLADLQARYEQEADRNEGEFQRKFADFLQGQKEFPANILLKRQAELQEVMERGIAFRKEAQELLDKAEKDLMNEVYNQLNAAITAVGMEQGYAFILNTDGNASPYINPLMGDDVTDMVRVKLGILNELPATEADTVEATATQGDGAPAIQGDESPATQGDEKPATQNGENPANQGDGASASPIGETTTSQPE